MCCRLGAWVPSQPLRSLQVFCYAAGLHPACFPEPRCWVLAGFLPRVLFTLQIVKGIKARGVSGQYACPDLLSAVAHTYSPWVSRGAVESQAEEAACCFGWGVLERKVMSEIKRNETVRVTSLGCSGNGAMCCRDLLLCCDSWVHFQAVFVVFLGRLLCRDHCVSFSSVTDLYRAQSRTVLGVHRAPLLGLSYGTPRFLSCNATFNFSK